MALQNDPFPREKRVTMSYIKALFISIIAATGLLVTSCSNLPTTTATTATVTVTAAPSAAMTLREGQDFAMCKNLVSAVQGPVTTCDFAYEVRADYLASGKSTVTVRTKSPVTGFNYMMACSGGFTAEFKNGSRRGAAFCEERGSDDPNGVNDAYVIALL